MDDLSLPQEMEKVLVQALESKDWNFVYGIAEKYALEEATCLLVLDAIIAEQANWHWKHPTGEMLEMMKMDWEEKLSKSK